MTIPESVFVLNFLLIHITMFASYVFLGLNRVFAGLNLC